MVVNKIAIGDKIEGSCFCLKSLRQSGQDYYAVLSDSTGEIPCLLPKERYSDAMSSLVGKAVVIDGVALNGKNMTVYIKLRSVEEAPKGSFHPTEVFGGLDDTHIQMFRESILDATGRIPDTSIKALCAAVLNEERLTLLSVLPASLSMHGKYRGGALSATAVVPRICMQTGVQYQKWGTGLYDSPLDWSVLICAALLHAAAIPKYYTPEPFQKTAIASSVGYLPLLTGVIDETIKANGIPVSERAYCLILNAIASAVPMRTGLKAASREGVILRHSLLLYEELDQIDAGIQEHETQEGEEYFFDPSMRRYILTVKDKEVAA